MSPSNRFNDNDYDVPVEKKPRVAVRDELLDLLRTQPAVMSTGGQVHIHLDATADNCFTVPLTSPYLRGWLTVRHNSDNRPAPSDGQIRQALRIKEAECLGGSTRNVRCAMNVRYAWDPNHRIPVPDVDAQGLVTRDYSTAPAAPAFVLSLNTARGRHVAVTSERWVIHPGQTSFIYDPIQQLMPDPVPSMDDPAAALQPFRKLLRLDQSRHDATWKTLLAWTLCAMRGPKDATFHDYPILNLIGSEDSGKSVTAKLLTQLLDPTLTPIHSIPTTERLLHGLAANHHILTFDDPGKINPEKSRYLSRLASGVTSLHSQLQGMLVRPIILTTTEEKETRHLASKVVDVDLPPLADPLTQAQIQNQFEEMRPQILGALLTLLVRDFNTPPPFLPNRKTRNQKIEESVTQFLKTNAAAGNQAWTGTATDLVKALTNTLVTQTSVCSLALSPEAMGRALDQMKSIIVTRPQRKSKERPIHLELPNREPEQPAPPPPEAPTCTGEPKEPQSQNTRTATTAVSISVTGAEVHNQVARHPGIERIESGR